MFDYINNQDKKQMQEPPEWYQQNALGQFVGQQRDKAQQWFGHVLGVKSQNPQTNPLLQYRDQLKQQSPTGQAANSYFKGVMDPLQTAADEQRKRYETELNTIYNNAITKMGLR